MCPLYECKCVLYSIFQPLTVCDTAWIQYHILNGCFRDFCVSESDSWVENCRRHTIKRRRLRARERETERGGDASSAAFLSAQCTLTHTLQYVTLFRFCSRRSLPLTCSKRIVFVFPKACRLVVVVAIRTHIDSTCIQRVSFDSFTSYRLWIV